MDLKLKGDQRQQLLQAIISAYPSETDLEMMVSFKLEENLDAIAGGGNRTQVTFNLIKWAEARGKLGRLIFAAYETNPGNQELRDFYQSTIQQKFILNAASVDFTTTDIGPAIEWQGPTEELQLQSLFKAEPDFWDVSFFKRAIERAASVCRLEIPSQKIQGTGVLIADRLVLTNYHVLKLDENSDMQTNALNAVLRFGYFTSDSGNQTEGHVFKLDRQNPILHFSPTEKLDYVLLQVESGILQAKDIQPARWDAFRLTPKTKVSMFPFRREECAVMLSQLSL